MARGAVLPAIARPKLTYARSCPRLAIAQAAVLQGGTSDFAAIAKRDPPRVVAAWGAATSARDNPMSARGNLIGVFRDKTALRLGYSFAELVRPGKG